MVKRVDVDWTGDEHHDSRLRRVSDWVPLGREVNALGLAHDVDEQNEASVRAASTWFTDHPDSRPDFGNAE